MDAQASGLDEKSLDYDLDSNVRLDKKLKVHVKT